MNFNYMQNVPEWTNTPQTKGLPTHHRKTVEKLLHMTNRLTFRHVVSVNRKYDFWTSEHSVIL